MGINKNSADVLCRSAHEMKINENLSGGAILQAIVNAQTETSGGEKTRSTGRGGVPDRPYSRSIKLWQIVNPRCRVIIQESHPMQ
jgi:hypothetical protein